MSEEAIIEQPAVETPPVETPPPQAAPVDEEAALDQQLEEQTIDLPEGEKLVPLSAVTTVREKLKTAKSEAARAKDLEAELAALRGQMDEARPWIEAAKTIAATRQLQPQDRPPDQPTVDPQHTAQLTELARTLDLYTPDGKFDLDKAQKIHAYNQSVAEQTAQRIVAPVQRDNLQQRASVMFERAMKTVGTDGSQPDPQILRDVWGRLDPSFTATEEGAREAWVAALGRSVAAGRVTKATATPAPKPEIPAPLLTEKAGGRDAPAHHALSEMERRAIKDMGITEKEYLEADTRPWMKGRR